MLTRTSPEYDAARHGFQRRDPHRPEVIFPVTNATEVEEAVRYAIDHDKRIAVQASGHGLTTKKMPDCVWLKPERRCELEFVERTQSGRLRHAVFRRLIS